MSRPSRDRNGLDVAFVIAQRGTCCRRKVGCLLVDKDHITLGTGYNGPASGMQHCIDVPCAGAGLPSGTGLDACEAIHAEANAIMRCPDVRRIHTCYVTVSPCMSCLKLLLGTGCQRIVFAEEYVKREARVLWERAGREWALLERETAWGAA